jgi:hypothetical protein
MIKSMLLDKNSKYFTYDTSFMPKNWLFLALIELNLYFYNILAIKYLGTTPVAHFHQ